MGNSRLILALPLLFLLLFSYSISASYPTGGKQLHLEFENNLNDVSGNNYTFIAVGNNAQYALGKKGQAIYFNGTYRIENSVQMPLLNFNLNNSFSLVAWVYLHYLPASGYYYSIFEVDEYPVPSGLGIYLCVCSDGRVRFGLSVRGTGIISINSATTLQTATWYFVAATYDGGTRQMKLYINGVYENITTVPSWSSVAPSKPWCIGGRLGNPTGYQMNGKVDEAAVYNRVLTSDEISQMTTILNMWVKENTVWAENATVFANTSVYFKFIDNTYNYVTVQGIRTDENIWYANVNLPPGQYLVNVYNENGIDENMGTIIDFEDQNEFNFGNYAGLTTDWKKSGNKSAYLDISVNTSTYVETKTPKRFYGRASFWAYYQFTISSSNYITFAVKSGETTIFSTTFSDTITFENKVWISIPIFSYATIRFELYSSNPAYAYGEVKVDLFFTENLLVENLCTTFSSSDAYYDWDVTLSGNYFRSIAPFSLPQIETIVEEDKRTFSGGTGSSWSVQYRVTKHPGSTVPVIVKAKIGDQLKIFNFSYNVKENMRIKVDVLWEENLQPAQLNNVKIEILTDWGTYIHENVSLPTYCEYHAVQPEYPKIVKVWSGGYYRETRGRRETIVFWADPDTIALFTFRLYDQTGGYWNGNLVIKRTVRENTITITDTPWDVNRQAFACLSVGARYTIWVYGNAPLRLVGPFVALNPLEEKVVYISDIVFENQYRFEEIIIDVFFNENENIFKLYFEDPTEKTEKVEVLFVSDNGFEKVFIENNRFYLTVLNVSFVQVKVHPQGFVFSKVISPQFTGISIPVPSFPLSPLSIFAMILSVFIALSFTKSTTRVGIFALSMFIIVFILLGWIPAPNRILISVIIAVFAGLYLLGGERE